MPRRNSPSRLVLLLSAAFACGDDKGESTSDTSTSETSTSTSTSGTSTTGTSTSSTSTSTSGTSTSTSDTPTTAATTGVDTSGFDLFKISRAAGPCAPESDCDGFVELLASGTLRVERFGDVEDAVIEVEVSAEDFAAAVVVFADPALVALLDGPDPLCQPPTDIFESMLVEIDGAAHDATTTACSDAPLVAAREMAAALRMQYAP